MNMKDIRPEDHVETPSTEAADGWTPELRAAKRRIMEWSKRNPGRDPIYGYIADAMQRAIKNED